MFGQTCSSTVAPTSIVNISSLSAPPRPAGGIKDSWLVDYQATLNSLEAARASGASHFVLLSAICVQVGLVCGGQGLRPGLGEEQVLGEGGSVSSEEAQFPWVARVMSWAAVTPPPFCAVSAHQHQHPTSTRPPTYQSCPRPAPSLPPLSSPQRPLLEFQKAKLAFEEKLMGAGNITYSIVRPTAFFKSLAGQVSARCCCPPGLVCATAAVC